MKKNGIVKENKIIIIIGIIMFVPIAYYFLYALPKHNQSIENLKLQELEYQREKDKLENERIENEKYEKENSFNFCLERAEEQKNLDIKTYCDAGYKECTINIDEYNREYGDTYEYDGTSRRKSYVECEKFAYKDGGCVIKKEYLEKIETNLENEKDMCVKMYSN